MTHRNHLPTRRHSTTTKISYLSRVYHVTVGFYPNGKVGEVFTHGSKLGTELDGFIDDTCVALSLLFQNGYAPERLADSMGKDEFGGHASVVGAILEVATIEAEEHKA